MHLLLILCFLSFAAAQDMVDTVEAVAPQEQINTELKQGEEVKATYTLMPSEFFQLAFSFWIPRIVNSSYYFYDYSNLSSVKRKHDILGIDFVIDFDFIATDWLGLGIFAGVGILQHDSVSVIAFENVGEIIWGINAKKLFWPFKRLMIPVALGLSHRFQWTDMDNGLIADFINSPKLSQEADYYFYKQKVISRSNFEIIPSIDLQFLLGEGKPSLYVGYMYRMSFSGDWKFFYDGKTWKVPEEYNPLQNAKESFFGIPGTFRFGIKFLSKGSK